MTDTSMSALTKSINTIGTAFEEFKKTNDEIVGSLKKGNESLAAELSQKLSKIESDITVATKAKKDIEIEMNAQRERLEELEARSKTPGKTSRQKLADEYNSAFNEWVRAKGMSPTIEEKLHNLSKKDVTVASVAGGGYAVPEEISRQITLLEEKYSPVRRLVKVVPVGTSDYKELVDLNNASAGWVGENGSRTATNTPQLREVAPTHGELYAYPQASEWSLDDMFFNVEEWLAESVARRFTIAEGDAVIRGDGTNKPTGLLNTTPVTTADHASPLRAAAAYQYVANTSSPTGTVLLPDSLIDLQYTLNSAYRANATWVMNSTTTGAVRKLKDTNGQYLWQPSLQVGQPDMLLGRSVETWEQMDDIGNNAFPIAFGDWKQGYLLTERVGLRITRDNVTNVGFVRFYVRRREGGKPLNNDAIKFLRTV